MHEQYSIQRFGLMSSLLSAGGMYRVDHVVGRWRYTEAVWADYKHPTALLQIAHRLLVNKQMFWSTYNTDVILMANSATTAPVRIWNRDESNV